MSTAADASEGGAFEFSDLEAPLPAAVSLAGPPMPPQQRVYFYSSDEWELFIREWATGLGENYVQIKRLGGPNDRGVDVAAFKTQDGFEGPWDCFQGKHYSAALTPSDAIPEMVKVFASVVAGHYVMPDRYGFLAPRGCGPTLNRLLSSPATLRDKFLEHIDAGDTHARLPQEEALQDIRKLAAETDFSLFRSVELPEALDTHSKTQYYVARFGGPLPARPSVDIPPTELGDHEARYVRKLIDAYAEQQAIDPEDVAALSSHASFGDHFHRQRVSFYSAEALRLYARDSVPEGTFESLQDDVHSGVIEVAEADHEYGLDRLREVLTLSTQLDLSAHALVSVSRLEDRKGICHQLANEDRLTWTDGTS